MTRFELVGLLDSFDQKLRVLVDCTRFESRAVSFVRPSGKVVFTQLSSARVVRLVAVIGQELPHFRRDGFVDDFVDQRARIVRIDGFVAKAVDDFALLVHHVVEIERAFALQVIALLDALLRGLDRFVQPRMLEFLAFLEAEALHDLRHAIGRAEVAHEIVFEADVEARAARIALARATSAQLAVDAARFVPLGADDVEAAALRHAGAEFNVGAAARHVGGDRDRARLAGAGDDLRFLHVDTSRSARCAESFRA